MASPVPERPNSNVSGILRQGAAWVRSIIARNFLLKLLSVGIAVLLWGMVREEQDVDDIVQVYLKIEDLEEILFLDPVPGFVSVRLIGPRSRLRQAQQVRLEMTIDMTTAIPGENTYNVANYQIRNLPAGVSTAAFHPSELRLRVDHKGQKELRVRPATTGNPADDHIISTLKVDPEVVVLEGARSHLDGIDHIQTSAIDIEGIKADKKVHIGLEYGQLYVWPQNKLDGVNVEIDVDEVRSERVFAKVPVKLAPALGVVETTPTTVEVVVEGLASQVAKLKDTGVIVAVQSETPLDVDSLPMQLTWGFVNADEKKPTLGARVAGGGAGVQILEVKPSTITLRAQNDEADDTPDEETP